MADDSDGEGFYDDPFEDASDGDDSCGEEEYDEGCVGPSDEEDDDSNGEGMCEVPCCSDEDCEADDSEDLCDDDDDGESEEALPDVDDDDDGESEELCDEEGNGEELVDDPCDEDDEEGDGDAEDLCEDRPSNDGEEGEREVSSVSGSSLADGTDMSDSVQDDSNSSEVEDERPTRAPWSMPHMQFMDQTYTDSDDTDYTGDYDSDDTDYDVGEYELRRLPASRAVVESLPEATLGEEEAACGCAVCKDVFELGQHVVRLPCKHYFHGDCIRPWLAIRNTCPVCRYQLPTDDVESPQGEAQQLGVLTSVARQGETQQSGGRDGGDGRGATTGARDARG